MDRQTKRELWILAIGTILFEAPFLAVAALALAGRQADRSPNILFRGASVRTADI